MRKKEINSDFNLMEGFRLGHQKCFTEVFNLFYASLCHYSLKITQDQAVAEDIVEDSFIKIWERRDMFFEINVLKSYIYTTVRNASLNWIKKDRNIIFLSENIEQVVLFDADDSFKHIIGSEVFNKLSKALEKLSPQSRQIIKMIFFEGKNTRTVAEELGISQSTVKTQKGRSLHKLKANLISPKQ